MKRPLIFLFIVLVLSSCSEDTPIGIWDDIIKLSTKYVELSSDQDSTVITTEGSWWWIDGITLGDSTYSYYNNDNIDLESDSYSIVEESFSVERRDSHTLWVKMDANSTGEERTLKIFLEAGDYFDSVTVLQTAN